MSSRPHLHKKTINLTSRTNDDLELAARLSGDNQTDTINRAIRAYARVLQLQEHGGRVLAEEKVPHGAVIQRLLEFL